MSSSGAHAQKVNGSRPVASLDLVYGLLKIVFCLGGLSWLGCSHGSAQLRFQSVQSEYSGLDFQNKIHLTDSFNILHYMYFFNGGGVAAGDINSDGLPDLYLAGNMVSNRLYLNQGDLKFQDVTESSMTETMGWTSGVVMVDINADGWLDMYVCQTGYPDPQRRKNLLFINQKDNTFTEEAERYGLADTSYSTQAAFFDYDRDGDLDMYLLNHDHQFYGANAPLPKKTEGQSKNVDRLYEHRKYPDGSHYFTDISKQAGIAFEGFGLGVAISDINQDGWADIYVANDFISNDLLYINLRNGTFENQISQYLRHQSHNGMGCDIADIDNDGLADIFVADMLPRHYERLKMMAMNSSSDIFQLADRLGYEPQFTRNTLQWNQGQVADSTSSMLFSEIGQLAGIHRTDWSWTGWMADVDLDGWKDIFITNGYYRDITNRDFIAYRKRRSSFTTQAFQDSFYHELLTDLPEVRMKNYLFNNNRDLTFRDVTSEWMAPDESLSHGAVMVDLDGDGDLDIVTNEMEAPASLFENRTIPDHQSHHYLKVKLKGSPENTSGIGAKISLYQGHQIQFLEYYGSRGYYSCSMAPIHFGLGPGNTIDSVIITWPNGNKKRLFNIDADQTILVHDQPGAILEEREGRSTNTLFKASTTTTMRHVENRFPAFKMHHLLYHSKAQQGPHLTSGDIDGDGLTDLFVGGAALKSGHLLIQDEERFNAQPWRHDSISEDLGSLFFDSDGDGDLDLYIVSGGSSFAAGSRFYQDRLYQNNGSGLFSRDSSALPSMTASGSCVVAADMDQDGDADLFVGGRHVPGAFPLAPRSYLLENNHGTFRDVTKTWHPDLDHIGMVTDAIWTDQNNDGLIDLILVGEWMPITLFINTGNHFKTSNLSIHGLEQSVGWWNCIASADVDLDGDEDYLLGNAGLNMTLKASPDRPLQLYHGDFDENGETEVLLSHFELMEDGSWSEVPFIDRDPLLQQMPALAKKFTSYAAFAQEDMESILAGIDVRKWTATVLASGCLINEGEASFTWHPFEHAAQIAPIYAITTHDINADEIPDLLAFGNSRDYILEIGHQDASMGYVGLGNGMGTFGALSNAKTGIFAKGNYRSIDLLDFHKNKLLVAAQNDGPLQCWTLHSEAFGLLEPE